MTDFLRSVSHTIATVLN